MTFLFQSMTIMMNNEEAKYRKEKREKQFDEKVKLENRITELESRL